MTTLFNNLHPYGFYTLCVIECVIGVIAHYIICVLRQPVPFKIFRRPFFESQEYALFDPPNKPSTAQLSLKIHWHVQVIPCGLRSSSGWYAVWRKSYSFQSFSWRQLQSLHQCYSLNGDYSNLWYSVKSLNISSSVAVLILCIAGIKLFRGTFSDSSQLYWILFFTLLIFHFDYRRYSETFVVDFVVATFLVTKVIS